MGVSTLTVDAKGRMAIPAKYRDGLAESCASRLVVTINPNSLDKCLWLYPENEWRDIARKLARLPNMDRQHQLVQRLVLGHASDQELDGQGRINVPAELRDYAGIGKKVALVGQVHKFEIWSEESWAGNREEWIGQNPMAAENLTDELRSISL